MNELLSVANASILPPVSLKVGLVKFGVFNQDARKVPVAPLFFASYSNTAFGMRKLPVDTKTLPIVPGNFIWGGLLDLRFGHWLTETLPVLISLAPRLQQNPDLRVAFVIHKRTASEKELSNLDSIHCISFFLEKLGISTSQFHIISRPTRLEHLSIPESVLKSRFRYSEELNGFIDALELPVSSTAPEKVFIRKSEESGFRQRILNFAEIQDEFTRSGFQIVEPETLSIKDQIALFRGTRVLAGESGSALHWSLYSQSIRKVISLGWKLRLQKSICTLRGQSYSIVQSHLTGAIKARSQSVPVRLVKQAIQKTP